MTSLHSPHGSSRPSLSEYNMSYLHEHMEKPGLSASTLRLALVLLATLTVIAAALLSVAEL